jgi:tripartite-type tricarboxylate transporter receptor subunit TctC
MRLGYDAQRDIAALSAVMVVPLLVAGTSALPALGLVAALRRPEALRWASSGVGTTGHLALEAVRQASGAAIVHVPYKGGGQQINDALAGHFELLSTNVAPPQLAWVQAGRLRALAVGAPQRLRHLPQVATLAELGFASANLASTFGLFAPAATPPQRLAALHQQVDAVLAEPAWQQQLLAAEHLPLRWSRAAFSAHVAEESRQRAQQVKQLGAALADDPA